jgi:RNA recognition motif-containing protein
MAKKLYVGNLAYNVSEDDLRETFEKAGEIESVKIITDRDTGRSKGFGFVEMASEEAAAKAIAELNGTALMDRNITVSEARPQTDKGRMGGRGGQDRPFGRGKGPNRWR